MGYLPLPGARADTHAVGPVPAAVREALRLDPFYQKHISVAGFPIVSSTNVSDFALREAAWILGRMFAGREELLQVMATQGVRVAVMAHHEYTTDLPEQRRMKPRVFWDRRARGLGGRVVSCGEENLLGFPNDPYSTENLLIHEFAHALHTYGLRAVDPTFDRRLRAAFTNATQRGLWKGTYAATNPGEYWAEAVQCWFDNNRQNDALHNHVNTRAELREYDPDLARLCEEVFGDNPWRYRKPQDRQPPERAHLAGYDAAQAPRFRWRQEPVPEVPRVLLQTELGDMEVELDPRRAPVTVTNFLRYVHDGLYADGEFFRLVTPEDQPGNGVMIQGILARANPAKADEFPLPIPLELAQGTGLRPAEGALVMAREGPDTARDRFIICLDNSPAPDSGEQRLSGSPGAAVFGRVVKGIEVARKIQAAPADGQSLTPPLRIQRAVRLN